MGEVVLDDEFCQDRHTLYGRLRADDPVCRVTMPDGLKVWLVTRYADARAVLSHPGLSKDSRGAAPYHDRQESEGARRTPLARVLTAHMLNRDAPDHTRLRRLVGKAFTLRRVELLRPRIEEIASALLDGLADQVDLLDAYAFPLSATVAGELFGVPAEQRAHFRALTNRIGLGTEPEAIVHASFAMAEYLTGLVELKRATPGDDLITALVQARDEDDRLDETELVSMAFLLLSAGFETTGHFIGNAVRSLLLAPDQLAALKADPAVLPRAVEELLRYDGPAGTTTLRITTEPVQVGDVVIPDGEFVLVPLGSPNRDEARFADADRLDIHRDAGGHIAFGHGIHHCVGAPLARLEGRIAIGLLFERFPGLALVDQEALRWRNNTLFRGLVELPVTTRA